MSGWAGRAAAQVRAIAGPRRLVRALLFFTVSPVLLALIPFGGCVLPVGPEFQDPTEEDNQVPYFLPPPGGPDGPPFYQQTVTLSGTQTFVAKVGDANTDQTLQVRWIANYPPISSATMPISTPDKSGQRTLEDPTWSFKLNVNCSMFMQGADPNLVVIVSDHGFIDPSIDPYSRSQEPYNYDEKGNFIATMTGWRITGCQ
jgi:hypothetical protein